MPNINFNKSIFYIISLSIFIYPSYNNIFFDGLILNKFSEIFVIFFILPVIYLFKLKFQKLEIFLIFLLVLFKFFLIILTPNTGIVLKQSLITDNNKININHFDSKINFKEESIIYKDLNDYHEYPFEWINYVNPYNGQIGPNCHLVPCFNLFQKIDNYEILLNIHSYIYLKQDSKLGFILSGSNSQNLTLISKNNKKYTLPTLIDSELSKFDNFPILKKGIYKLRGEFILKNSKNLTFKPKILINNKIYSAFNKKIFFQDKIENIFFIKINEIISLLFNIISILIFLCFLLKFFKSISNNLPYKKFKIFYLNQIFFIILFFLIYYLINENVFINFLENNKSLSQILSGTFIVAIYILFICIILFFKNKSIDFDLFDSDLFFYNFFIIVFTLFFVLFFYFDEIYKFKIHSQGDDWWVFEYYAYRIVILKEYLRAGEDIIYFRPLIRYIFAIYHFLFGQTFFIHRLGDVWMILLSGLFFLKTIKFYNFNRLLSLFFTLFLLCNYFGETFKLLIGRGLSEYYASFLLILLTYLILRNSNNFSIRIIFYLSLIGILGIWLREDHLFVTMALIVLAIPSFIQNDNFFGLFKSFILKYKFLVCSYLFFISVGFFLIFFRNYLVSGQFMASDIHYNVDSINQKSWLQIYTILSGSPFSHFPRTFFLINLIALLLSIYSLFKFKVRIEILSFSIILISIILPYTFLNNWGYYPRYSIHLLPYSFLLLILFFRKKIEFFYENYLK